MTTAATKKTDTLAAAFLKAQSEFPGISKDGKADAGSFSYKYGTLPAILRAVLPVLHENDLALTQLFSEGKIVTKLVHESGEMVSEMECSQSGLKPQDFGAKISYLRRYSLTAMLGISPDDDTDATGVGAGEGEGKGETPASIHDITARRLITEDRDLIREWSIAELKTEADALLVVSDFLGTLDADPDGDLYTIAKRALGCVIDERNAG